MSASRTPERPASVFHFSWDLIYCCSFLLLLMFYSKIQHVSFIFNETYFQTCIFQIKLRLYQVSVPGFCLHLLTHRKRVFGTDTAEKNNVCRPTAVGGYLLSVSLLPEQTLESSRRPDEQSVSSGWSCRRNFQHHLLTPPPADSENNISDAS